VNAYENVLLFFVVVVVSFDFNLETFLKKKTTKQKKKNERTKKLIFSNWLNEKIHYKPKNKF
jgi:hypothetical protein